MSTTTKKDLIDRIADETGQSRSAVKRTVQSFLNLVIRELSEGNRLELRDFGVFEMRHRPARTAQNPRTMQPITVAASNTVKFKAGRMMRMALDGEIDPRTLTPVDGSTVDGSARADGSSANATANKSSRAAGSRDVEYEVVVGGRTPRR